MSKYQLMVQRGRVGKVEPTTYAPRSLRATQELFHYYSTTWPNNMYWIQRCN